MARTSTVDEQFLALYEEHAARVHTFCLRLTGSREDAADALQETFAAVFARLQDGLVLEHPRAYLLTAARHACLRRLGEHVRVEVTDEVPEVVEAGVLPDGEREALTQDLRVRVRAANDRLPVRQREVLVLREVEGLSHEAIGEHMGLTPNAVAQLSWRARVNLREQVRRDALRSIAPATIECEDALSLLALVEDGPLRPARQAWLDEHLEGCERCGANRAAMAEAGAIYRLWVPAGGLPLAATAMLGAVRGGAAVAPAPAPGGGGGGAPAVPPVVVAVIAAVAVAAAAVAAGVGLPGGSPVAPSGGVASAQAASAPPATAPASAPAAPAAPAPAPAPAAAAAVASFTAVAASPVELPAVEAPAPAAPAPAAPAEPAAPPATDAARDEAPAEQDAPAEPAVELPAPVEAAVPVVAQAVAPSPEPVVVAAPEPLAQQPVAPAAVVEPTPVAPTPVEPTPVEPPADPAPVEPPADPAPVEPPADPTPPIDPVDPVVIVDDPVSDEDDEPDCRPGKGNNGNGQGGQKPTCS